MPLLHQRKVAASKQPPCRIEKSLLAQYFGRGAGDGCGEAGIFMHVQSLGSADCAT